MLTSLKSTLSTVTSTLQAVRELPGTLKEAIAFTRENSEVKRELEAANKQLDKGLRLHLEWMNLCLGRNEELDIERFVNNEQWDWAKGRIEALQFIINETRESLSVLSSSLGYGLGGENEPLASMVDRVNEGIKHHLAVMTNMRDKAQLARDEALTKLARYEAAEKWLSRWRWNRETPCPFPPDTFVQYRECEQVTPSSPNENHANEPLKEMSHTCMVSELSDSDEWRPHVECLKFYEAFKDV